MSLHHIANHLASKGRNGDTTLVHMTKGEVAGLQALAKAHGTSLTKNPDTGLPEAFGLKQLLPMAAGAALTPFVGPMGAAAIVGGLGYMHTGSLSQGLMAGLGAYGGAGLMGMAGTGAAAGTQAAAGEAAIAGETAAQQAVEQQAAQQLSATQAAELGAPGVYAPANQVSADVAAQSARDYASNAAGNSYELSGINDTYIGTPAGSTPTGTFRPSFGGEGAYAPGTMPARTVNAVTTSGTGFTPETQTALNTNYSTDAFAANAAASPWKTAGYGAAALAPEILKQSEYTAPEIKGDSDMGQRYAYDSGYDNSVPGRTSQPSYTAVSNEEAKKLYGFAEGGEVGYPGEPVVRMASGGPAGYTGNVGDYSAADAQAARGGYGLGIDYSGYDTAPNDGRGIAAVLPQSKAVEGANPNQNIVDLYKEVEVKRIADEKAAAEKAAAEAAAAEPAPDPSSYWGGAGVAKGGLMPNDLHYAQGGISTLGGYSDGGRLLKGPGDGMSDNIPAKIGAKQPARLADGEFVVPADVVSHLGNGSTDAGAKQLYKMMDKIRTARTGRKAQGKQVNPNKFLPA